MENISILSNKLEVKEMNGRHVANVGCETHGRPSFRLWVNRNIPFVEGEEYGIKVKYVNLGNTKIVPVKSSSVRAKNLIPSASWNTFEYSCEAGYRGQSWFRVYREINDKEPIGISDRTEEDIIITDDVIIVPFAIFHSERGSLGVSMGALISTTLPHLIIEWGRDGRCYGAPEYGVSICYPDGRIFNYYDVNVEDIEDIDY